MKKFSIILVVAILAMSLVTVFAETPADISITSGCKSLDAQIPALGTMPLVSNTSAAILYETTT